jgi:hypothetical protein
VSAVTYSLIFPFALQPGREITGLEDPVDFRHGELRIAIHRFRDRYELRIDNFSSQQAAADYVGTSWRALAWMLLNSGLAFAAETELQTVEYVDDPEGAARRLESQWGVKTEGRVDTLLDGGRPGIVQSDKRFKSITTWPPTVVISTPAEQVKEVILEGLSLAGERSHVDERLRTAVDLYSAYYSETTSNARLITLVMALETLTTPQQKTQPVLELLEKWRLELNQLKETEHRGSYTYLDLDALERELIFRREESIRSSVRTLVFETLNEAGDASALDLSRRAVEVYDRRSTLVHEGSLDTEELVRATREAKEIVEAVLRAKLSAA